MKKLLYILTATFMMASCCNENTEVERDIQSAKIEDFCDVYKTKIENHTYILLFGHYHLALEHDPECPYCKEHGFPEHKLETTDY
jgi:hypothetical protein